MELSSSIKARLEIFAQEESFRIEINCFAKKILLFSRIKDFLYFDSLKFWELQFTADEK